jgi:hypothetical protein
MKTEKSFSSVDSEFFTGKASIFYNPNLINTSGKLGIFDRLGNYFPAELQIIVQHSKTHHLRAYSLPLDDLCASSFRITKLNLLHSWEGPVDKIIKVRSSPESRFVVLTDGINIEVYQICVYQLFYITIIPSKSTKGSPVFTWMRDGKHR